MECSPFAPTPLAIVMIVMAIVTGIMAVAMMACEIREYRESARRRDAVLRDRAESARRREAMR